MENGKYNYRFFTEKVFNYVKIKSPKKLQTLIYRKPNSGGVSMVNRRNISLEDIKGITSN